MATTHTYLPFANKLNRSINEDDVTFVKNRNINYTNQCYFKCGFCGFSKRNFGLGFKFAKTQNEGLGFRIAKAQNQGLGFQNDANQGLGFEISKKMNGCGAGAPHRFIFFEIANPKP